MLRSHSPAWSYPTRYTFEDPSDRLPVDAKTYMEAFVAAAQQLRPRYAIPFASGICHLHREVRDENRFLVSAPEMKAYFEANSTRAPQTSLVVMPVGSTLVVRVRFQPRRRRRRRYGRVRGAASARSAGAARKSLPFRRTEADRIRRLRQLLYKVFQGDVVPTPADEGALGLPDREAAARVLVRRFSQRQDRSGWSVCPRPTTAR